MPLGWQLKTFIFRHSLCCSSTHPVISPSYY